MPSLSAPRVARESLAATAWLLFFLMFFTSNLLISLTLSK
jgi:hypothetical protein